MPPLRRRFCQRFGRSSGYFPVGDGSRFNHRQREKYKEYEAECIAVKGKCKSLYDLLLAAVDKDTEAYLAVSSAFRLPKETEEEKAARSKAIAEATLVATLVPYETLTYCFEGILLAERLVGKSNPNAASDVGVAALSFLAGLEGAWLNVKINLPGVKDKDKAEHFAQTGMRLCEEGKLRAAKFILK